MRSRRGLCGPRASPSATSRVPTEGGWLSRSTDRRYVLSEADPCARSNPVRSSWCSQLVDPTPAGAPRGRRRRGLRAVEQVCPYGDQVRDGTTSTRCRSPHLTRSLVQPDSLVGKTKLLQVRRFDSTGGHALYAPYALYVRTLLPLPLASPHSRYALRLAARAKFPADASPVPRTVPSLP